MSDKPPPEGWSSEFRQLGAAKVRHEIASGHWPKDKAAAARQWIQLEDVRSWQKRAPQAEGRSRYRYRAWARYVVGTFSLLYALARLFRVMRFGH